MLTISFYSFKISLFDQIGFPSNNFLKNKKILMSYKDPNGQSGSKIKSFLRRKDGVKLEDFEKSSTPSNNEEFIKKKLTEQPARSSFGQSNEGPKLTFSQKFERFQSFFTFYKRRNFKDTFPIVAFVTFSCFVIWKMEAQLDKMRNKVYVQKTIKQQEIEKENEVLKLEIHCYNLLAYRASFER